MPMRCICASMTGKRALPLPAAIRSRTASGYWGRVAVLRERRGHRLGSRAVQELEEYLRGLDAREIELSAQLHAMKMYEALGYKEEGDLIYDEGQPHKMMRKFL